MKIIAVTSCPIGMAHTYMASAALKKAAKKKEVEIKVETQGSMGIRDKIKKQEIEEADIFHFGGGRGHAGAEAVSRECVDL